MKMKPMVTILVCVMAAGLASAQSPSIIQNTRNTMNAVSNRDTAASNEALGVGQAAPAAVKPEKSVSPSGRSASPAATKHTATGKRSSSSTSKHAATAAVGVAASASKDKPSTGIAAVSNNTDASGAGGNEASDGPVVPTSKNSANGRRDPFISPVVSHAGGSGCSTGKKCLEIGEISLRGVVHADNGFIAVVSNGLNKAYFLRENDPVFNGYVIKITGDSIVFQETLQDRLGKTFTREVVKKIPPPAV